MTNIDAVLKQEYDRLGFKFNPFKNFKDSWLVFADKCFLLESSRDLIAINVPQEGKEKSTAKGGYQFTNDSLITGYNRLERYKIEFERLPIIVQDWEMQTTLFIANICQQKGSDAYIVKMLLKDKQGTKDLYAKFHHTNPDSATLKRMDEVFV